LRYQRPQRDRSATPEPGEYAFLKLRYKRPNESASQLITIPVTDKVEAERLDSLSDDIRFAASVAAFGQKLRGETHLDDYTYDAIHALASGGRGADPFGYRSEFLSLLRLAKSLGTAHTSEKK
ncbi:MAG: YfbK domain-containing protein, partial [Methyloligellaceae bacterium]